MPGRRVPLGSWTRLRQMRAKLRFVLTWLLLFALPLHGWAAAAMINCGPSHHRMAHTAAVDGTTFGTIDRSTDMGHGAGHHATAVQGSHDHADEPTGHGHNELVKVGASKCSACSACCSAFALPTTIVSLASVPSASFVPPVLPDAVVFFLTTGPERPPKPSAA